MKQVLLLFMMIFAVSFGSTSCSMDDGGEGDHESEEENGTQYEKTETHNELHSGVRLILSYDSASSSLVGTIENTTNSNISQVRVEVHLSNGTELGPTTPVDLAPGQSQEVTLPAVREDFETWSAHAEVG